MPPILLWTVYQNRRHKGSRLHHVEKDIVKKEVEKRREAAKSRGVKPDGTGG